MRVVPISCLRDNYAYLVICDVSSVAAVVDPSESKPVLEAIAEQGVTLSAIWNTHHHWDHTGGNKGLLADYPALEVVGHESDKGRIHGQTRFAADGDVVELGDSIRAQIVFNPGHTSGAISYYMAEHSVVFTGDTLFLAGCGRVFEGTMPMMYESLMRLAALPGDTRVYCGHEYTASNLRFAAAVQPDSQMLGERAAQVAEIRGKDQPTIPGTIAEELVSNPFLRAGDPALAHALRTAQPTLAPQDDSPAAVFAGLRRWKDSFRDVGD